jgi:hypothetical protein
MIEGKRKKLGEIELGIFVSQLKVVMKKPESNNRDRETEKLVKD